MFRKAHRRVIGYLSVVAMLIGALVLPNVILCTAPGGHFAIELVSGGDCSGGVGGGSATPHKRADGCPSNCRDTQLGNSVQCNKPTLHTPPAVSVILIAAPNQTLSIAAIAVDPFFASVHPPLRELRTTVILC